MELEMWHLFIISNVILLASLIFRAIYYNTKDYRNLYSCLFVLVSIGIIIGTFIATIHYAFIEQNILPTDHKITVYSFLGVSIFYFGMMTIPILISIPEREQFEEIMKKYKLDKTLIK